MSAKVFALTAAGAAISGATVGWLMGRWRLHLHKCKPSSKKVGEFSSRVLDDVVRLYDWTDESSIQAAFRAVQERLVDEFLVYIATFGLPVEFLDRIRRMCHYNIKGGKYNRGMILVGNTCSLCTVLGVDSKTVVGSALVLGWCIEILQASFLVADDIMDGSLTRRGQPCWYQLKDVNMDAVNDALILESFVFWLIQQEFPSNTHSESFAAFTNLFRDVTFKTEIGQVMDLLSQPQGRRGPEILKRFTRDNLTLIVDYKTGYYSFYIPIACSMILTGLDSKEQLLAAEEISMLLGRKFQAQDDFLDCYGDPETIGKIGTDIQDHKCTWLLVEALEAANPDQRKVLEENLGINDQSKIDKVKEVYSQIGIPAIFAQSEAESYDLIKRKIDEVCDSIPSVVFERALALIHKRNK